MRLPVRLVGVASVLSALLSPAAAVAAEQGAPRGAASASSPSPASSDAGRAGSLRLTWERFRPLTTPTEESPPGGVALAPNGDVVVQRRGNRLLRFDDRGRLVSRVTLGPPYAGAGFGVEVAPDGLVHVPEGRSRDRDGSVWVVKRGGELVRTYSAGTTSGRPFSPDDVAVAKDGTQWVLEDLSDTLWRFDPDSEDEPVAHTGVRMRQTDSITTTSKGVAVADYGKHKVHLFDRQGRYLSSFGGLGTGDGKFQDGPYSVAWTGRWLLVVDASRRIQAFTPTGDFVGAVRGPYNTRDIDAGRGGRIAITGNTSGGSQGVFWLRISAR
ncbi:hypothetical protein [uncultured Nocardioides sp.]|uniref:hypothetical protein n=1 Tax=uncultured Nocardioides sp. TaxID=198441 RepID=UPI00260AA8C3|nr:hypothetical protein [uncultured Nocardioides sp.]